MKLKKFIVFILSALIIFSALPHSAAYADDLVSFGCENLREALSEITGKEEITTEDLLELNGKLDLSYKNIKSLKGLEYVQNIDELVLSFNNITDITPVTGLSNLKSLYLDYNWIKELPQETSLTSLEHIDISNNEIEAVPSGFFNMPNIKRIYMGDMALSAQPDFSSAADTLERLDISGAMLQNYDFISSLTNLELLMMNGCSMDSLPNISGLYRLGYLYFADNSISDLPDYLSSLPLIRLDFSGNLVSHMPQSFASMTNLEQLVMTDNYFRILPEEVTSMENLEVLMCGQNLIKDVPDSIINLENIRRASFASNDLTSLLKFQGFEIPYSYQISFSYNYLDLNDETNIDVLEDYRNNGGVQKSAHLFLTPIKADTQSVDFECSFDFTELARFTEDAKVNSLKLFEVSGNGLILLTERELTGDDKEKLIISYSGAEEGVHDYLVCLETTNGQWPEKTLKYSAEIRGVVVALAATPTPTVTAPQITATPAPETTPEPIQEGKIFPKYLLYILLLGVIIIISAIIAHFAINRRE